MLVIDIQRLLVDLLGRINLFFNFYINCLTTIARTVKKLLLITDIIAHILVKNEHTFFRMKDENDTLAFAVLLTKCICVDVLNDVEKII